MWMWGRGCNVWCICRWPVSGWCMCNHHITTCIVRGIVPIIITWLWRKGIHVKRYVMWPITWWWRFSRLWPLCCAEGWEKEDDRWMCRHFRSTRIAVRSRFIREILFVTQTMLPFIGLSFIEGSLITLTFFMTRMSLLNFSRWPFGLAPKSEKDSWVCKEVIWFCIWSILPSKTEIRLWYSWINSDIMVFEQSLRLSSHAFLKVGSIFSNEGKVWTRSPKELMSSLI